MSASNERFDELWSSDRIWKYSSIEYQKLSADGNVYGIIREGSKYYTLKQRLTEVLKRGLVYWWF